MSEEMRQLLTVLVPTYNRYDRLQRLLQYYRNAGLSAQLVVLDSSRELPPAAGALPELLSQPHVQHRRFSPDIEPLTKMWQGIQEVRTPYAVFVADDDFIVPGTMLEGVQVLARCPDISVVHGRSVMFGSSEAAVSPWVMAYPQGHWMEASASARLLNHLGRYTVMFYSVHRTEALQRNVQRVCEIGLDWHTWGEMALSGLAVIQGKALCLPRLYMLREGHPQMLSAQIRKARKLDGFDQLTDPSFTAAHGSYVMFRDCLVEELLQHEPMEVEQAREVVKLGFWRYLAIQMEGKWRLHAPARAGWPRRLREAARQVPALRRTWRTARAWIPHPPSAVSLDALRQPHSHYHRDFMPVYRMLIANGIADA